MALSAITRDKLAIIDKRIDSFISGYRQNIALLSNDNEELSYLLENYFANNEKGGLNIIHASAKYLGAKRFFKTISVGLLTNTCKQPVTLDMLILRCADTLPKTTAHIKKTLAQTDVQFSSIIAMLNIFIEETGKPCLLAIEEFQNLKKIFGQCFEEFSNFIITQRQCMILLASYRQENAVKILSTELNLLFGNFEIINCNNHPFTDRYAQIKDSLPCAENNSFIASFIINILDDNAIYYNHILNFIEANKNISSVDELIIKTIENTLYDPQTYLHQKFLSAIQYIEHTHKQPEALTQILIALSRGYARKADLVDLRLSEPKSIEPRLDKLCDENLVTNHGAIYRIKDRLFAFWLANIFPFHATYTSSLQRNAVWQQHIRAEVALFKAQINKPKIERVRHLTCLFKDDNFTIGNETYRLPTTQRANISSYPEENMHLIVGEGKEIMVMGVKDGNAKDNDVFGFAQKCASIKGRGVRKLFISLGTMPDAVRLAAKNQRFQAIDINELNNIMKIYNQPILSMQTNNENIGTL